MANETLFKVYKTGETVLAGSLAAVVPNHYHDGRYYTEAEIDIEVDELNTTITNTYNNLDGKIDEKEQESKDRDDGLDNRITTEVGTLNTTINTKEGESKSRDTALDNKITDLDDKLTNEETGLLKKQYDTITGETNGKIETLEGTLNVYKEKTVSIVLSATSWLNEVSPFYQTVSIDNVTANSKIDLQPTVQQIVDLQTDETTLVVENDKGVIKVWAIGYKPLRDYTIQATITEVVVQ